VRRPDFPGPKISGQILEKMTGNKQAFQKFSAHVRTGKTGLNLPENARIFATGPKKHEICQEITKNR
jgi:hypothetical protein